jgi:hypothetical protein
MNLLRLAEKVVALMNRSKTTENPLDRDNGPSLRDDAFAVSIRFEVSQVASAKC